MIFSAAARDAGRSHGDEDCLLQLCSRGYLFGQPVAVGYFGFPAVKRPIFAHAAQECPRSDGTLPFEEVAPQPDVAFPAAEADNWTTQQRKVPLFSGAPRFWELSAAERRHVKDSFYGSGEFPPEAFN